MRTVEQDADAIGETKFDALPERVQEALGELAGAAKEGLLALSVGVGLGVLTELMAEEVDEVVGPKGRHDAERAAVRHGHEAGQVTLGGRRVAVKRPRVRAANGGGEVALRTYAHFADRDPLTKVVLEQLLAGVSTRRFARTREPVGQDVVDAERSASKSAVSREFVGRTGEHLRALMTRSLVDVRLAALMLDGLELKGRCCVVALGVTTDGVKVPLGLWDGSTENKRVCVELLADLVDRGLDCDQGVLVVLDGGKALRAAVDEVFGHVPVQRCVRHKERNVLDHLPERDRAGVKRRLRAAWKLSDHQAAIERLEALAGELAHSHPGAAASLREGLPETVTLQRLGVHQQLWKTLSSTNPIESMIGICRATSRNVKRWQNGDMCLRWTAAGMLEAERQFRKIIGYKHLAALALAVERDVVAARATTSRPTSPPTTTEPAATLAAAHRSPDRHRKVPRRTGVRPDCWRSMI
jgi:transposase-like protein